VALEAIAPAAEADAAALVADSEWADVVADVVVDVVVCAKLALEDVDAAELDAELDTVSDAELPSPQNVIKRLTLSV